MNLPTLVHSLITGGWKLERARNREFTALMDRAETLRASDVLREGEGSRGRFYAGAQPGMNRPQPNVLSTPEDFKQAYQRIILIRAARQMEEDFPFLDGILGDYETYVVGDLQYFPNTGSPDADKAIREYLEWQFGQCDYSEMRDFTQLMTLAMRTMKRDGECGFTLIDVGDSIKISALSADRIGNPLIGANIGPNNFNGIIVDENTMAPVFYDIYRRLPKLNAYVFEERVPADQFIHFFDPFRFEQYHGVTAFKNAIENAFDAYDINKFSKLNIKWRASQLPYVTNEQGRPRGSGYQAQPNNQDGSTNPMTVNVDGVTSSYLKLGEAIVNYPNDFPNGQFLPMTSELKRDIALGAKLPAEFCYRSETGGVVQRFYVSKAKATFDQMKRLIRVRVLDRIKNRMIQKGIETGFLDLDRFGSLNESLQRFKGSWNMGRTISVDYGKETDADIKQIEAGLQSPDEYAAENCRDIRVVRAQIKQNAINVIQDAQEVAKATGVTLEVALPFVVKKFPNQKAPEGAPVAPATGPGFDAKGKVWTGTEFVDVKPGQPTPINADPLPPE
jgi:capsid protein